MMLGRLQSDGSMWPDDVAAAEAAGLQPTIPVRRIQVPPLERPWSFIKVPTPPPRQARERTHIERMIVEDRKRHHKKTEKSNRHIPKKSNEPTYCICHDVSYGQMVACDNDECPNEWYHFDCVGLKAPPRGKWFCQVCTKTNTSLSK